MQIQSKLVTFTQKILTSDVEVRISFLEFSIKSKRKESLELPQTLFCAYSVSYAAYDAAGDLLSRVPGRLRFEIIRAAVYANSFAPSLSGKSTSGSCRPTFRKSYYPFVKINTACRKV